MISRRKFLGTTAASAALAGLPASATADGEGSVMPTKGKKAARPLPVNGPRLGRYQLPYRLGFGCVAIGNGFAPTTDEIAQAALEGAWRAGVRYFDTSPFYGYGLSERRLGRFLHNHKPDEYVVSTKIGRLFKATSEPIPPSLWKDPAPFSYEYDYTAAGARRSIEDSLQRLGVSRIDIVFIHDLAPDNGEMGEKWVEQYEIAARGAMPELSKMREEGLIGAWGFGVNRPEPALRAIADADPDLMLLACQYSLLDHEQALAETFPKLEEKGVGVVVGAPLLAGFLAGRDRYLYGPSIPEGMVEKRAKVVRIADRHGIDLRTASLQFAAAHPVVSSVIPGARTADQARANAESFAVEIPADFWSELQAEKLIAAGAPVPA
jgi:D-threo-aldose 1-dehydrogenase